jgi:flagellar protein FliJ
MVSRFPLAGLLRLQRLREDTAASELAAANFRTSASRSRQSAARFDLAESPTEVSTGAALSAVAAARASSRSMLADLDAVLSGHEATARQAQEAFSAARSQSVRLEKLEAKHAERVAAADLLAEQTVLDELAAGAWHRSRKEGMR